mgnify:CR=1 FL=1
MRIAESTQKNVILGCYHEKREKCKRGKAPHEKGEEKDNSAYFSLLGSLTAMIFTGTLFLGGSYLFFIQLAEYGW